MKLITLFSFLSLIVGGALAGVLEDIGIDGLPYQCVSCATSCALKGPAQCSTCAATECADCSIASTVCETLADVSDRLPSKDSVEEALDFDYSACGTCSFDCLQETALGSFTEDQCRSCVATNCDECGTDVISFLQRPCEAKALLGELEEHLDNGEACAACAASCSEAVLTADCESCFQSEECSSCDLLADNICSFGGMGVPNWDNLPTLEEAMTLFENQDMFSGSQELMDLLGLAEGGISCDLNPCATNLATCLASAAVMDGVQDQVQGVLSDLLGDSALNDLMDMFPGSSASNSGEDDTEEQPSGSTDDLFQCGICSPQCLIEGSKAGCEGCMDDKCSGCSKSVCAMLDLNPFRALASKPKLQSRSLRSNLVYTLLRAKAKTRQPRRRTLNDFGVPYLDELIDTMQDVSPSSCACYDAFEQCASTRCTLMDVVGVTSGICPTTCGSSCYLNFEALDDMQSWFDQVIDMIPGGEADEIGEDEESGESGESEEGDEGTESQGEPDDLNNTEEPIDCVLGDTYNEFGPCSAQCGQGVRTATRKIVTLPKNGGRSCESMPNYFFAVKCEGTACSEEENTCVNGIRDGDETGPDCGGLLCEACLNGLPCKQDTDCGGPSQCFNLPSTLTGQSGRRCVSNSAADLMDAEESLFVKHSISFQNAKASTFNADARETFKTTIATTLGLSTDGSGVHIISARPTVDAAGRSKLDVHYIIAVEAGPGDVVAASAVEASKKRISANSDLLASTLMSNMPSKLPGVTSVETTANAQVSDATETTLNSPDSTQDNTGNNGETSDSSATLAITIGSAAVVLSAAIIIAAVLLRRRKQDGRTAPKNSWQEQASNESSSSLDTAAGEDLQPSAPVQRRNPMLTIPKKPIAYPPTSGAAHPYALTGDQYASTGYPKSP